MSKLTTLPAKAVQVFKAEGGMALLQRLAMFLRVRAHRLSRRMQKIRYETKVQPEWPVEQPLVSVIIPCYNYGKYVRGAIESVLNQTFQRFEILVVNDGSTDDYTRQVLQELGYEKTRVIHQANQGPAQTRNNGAAQARGKYVCFLDADDLIEPTYLEKTLTLLEADESLGSAYSWVQCFGDMDSLWKTSDMEPFFLSRGTTASVHGVIRKEAWECVKRENGAGYLSKYDGIIEDWVFWIDMVRCGFRGQVIEEPLIRYRVHKDSMSSQKEGRSSSLHKPGFERMLKILQDERRPFFHDRSYRKQLEGKLNRRVYIENARINLASPTYYKAGATPVA
ncbi:MAG: glycosyltransferase family 2 protein [Verrucomicrobia bacterium]|nr:glycosyltransferase family 2 protein [Verrucomicrobiota bacterium]